MSDSLSACDRLVKGFPLPLIHFLNTVQHKIFEGCKFCKFCCFPSKCENYFFENEQTASHVCSQSVNFIFHKIKILTHSKMTTN